MCCSPSPSGRFTAAIETPRARLRLLLPQFLQNRAVRPVVAVTAVHEFLQGALHCREFLYALRQVRHVGAGDAFSAALVHGIQAGWAIERVADFANRVGGYVASRRGGTPAWKIEEIVGA